MPMLKRKTFCGLRPPHQYFRNILPSPWLENRLLCTAVPFSYAPLSIVGQDKQIGLRLRNSHLHYVVRN